MELYTVYIVVVVLFLVDWILLNSGVSSYIRDDQIEAISTRLPVDKADLEKFFPK